MNTKKVMLTKKMDDHGDWLSEMWRDGKMESEDFIYEEGFHLNRCHLTTGRSWFRITCKKSGESHSGEREELLNVFHGRMTLDEFYDSPSLA